MTKTMTAKTPKTESIKVNVQQPEVDERAITKQGTDLSVKISEIAIKDQTTYNEAASLLAPVKQYISYLEGIFGPAKKALNVAILNLRNEEKRLIGPRLTFAEQLERTLKGKMSVFLVEEEDRKRKEARAEQEQKDKEAEIERKKLEKQAVKAEEKGNDAKADMLRTQAAAVVAAPVEVKKAVSFSGTGTTAKDDISFEIVDLHKFLAWAHDHHKVDISTLVEIKYNPIKAFIKGLPGHLELNPESVGVKVEKKKIIASA